MPDSPWHLLVVDDDAEVCKQLTELLQDEDIAHPTPLVFSETDFQRAVERIEHHRFDLVITDLREGALSAAAPAEEAGTRLLQEIMKRRFVPVIFNTGLPDEVGDYARDSPFVGVVTKGHPDDLVQAVKQQINDPMSRASRAILAHIESIQRSYLWDFVGPRWSSFTSEQQNIDLPHLLARRVVAGMSADVLDRTLEAEGLAPSGVDVHPLQYYVIPPVSEIALCGYLYKGLGESEETGWWVLLTPSCDVAQANRKGKLDFALFAKCELAAESDQIKGKKPEDVAQLFTRQPNRYYFLPSAIDIPDLLVDFQNVRVVNTEAFTKLGKATAAVDSPYAEELQSRFAQWYGRLGTPDLDYRQIAERLVQTAPQGSAADPTA